MAYIANRPVRFDRNYAIGERIPDGVIDPRMTTKLIGMGRIIRIDDEPEKTGAEGAESRQNGGNAGSEGNTHAGTENAPEGKSRGAEGIPDGEEKPEVYKCEECGRVFSTASGLATHSRTHNRKK